MTVKECYELMEGDYNDVISRLAKDERVEKYLRKFIVSEDYAELVKAVVLTSFEWEIFCKVKTENARTKLKLPENK